MTRIFRNSGLLLMVLGLSIASNPVDARRSKKAKHSIEERMEVFAEVFAAIENGDQNLAADKLIELIENPDHEYYHVDAYAQLGGILEKMGLQYSALLAYEAGLQIDASRIPSIAEKSIALVDSIGDTGILESIFASNLNLDVSPEVRSRMAYLAARSAFAKGDIGPAQGILMMVKPTDPDFPEAQNLLGVIKSQQGLHDSAIAPLQIGYQKGLQANKPAKFQDAVLINMARAYFGAKNYPQASVYYEQIPRSSSYWLDAQFERAWAHFHMGDMSGVLGFLHTLQSPFFEDEPYAEGELLRIYGMVMLCKFNEANKGIDNFEVRFGPHQQEYANVAQNSPADLFKAVQDAKKGNDTIVPEPLMRRYLEEDRMTDALKSVAMADAELIQLKSREGASSTWMTSRLESRKSAIVEAEGLRISKDLQTKADQLQSQITSLQISKLDILDMETQMLNRAAETGKMEETKRQVRREKRIRSGEMVWEYQGEYWADEAGYYRLNTKSDCPTSMYDK